MGFLGAMLPEQYGGSGASHVAYGLIAREIEAGRIFVTGDALLKRTMPQWLPRSGYAEVDGIRMLPAAG